MAEKKFVEGAFVSRRETAPEFIVTDISFDERFIEYFKNNCNAKGYLNLQLKTSEKTGKMYLDLNDWQPSNQSNSQESRQEEIQVENIPF